LGNYSSYQVETLAVTFEMETKSHERKSKTSFV
jgi:hypothetical protein